jgi:hypothetical protein
MARGVDWGPVAAKEFDTMLEQMLKSNKVSLDWWSVLLALAAAALVWAGILPHIPW